MDLSKFALEARKYRFKAEELLSYGYTQEDLAYYNSLNDLPENIYLEIGSDKLEDSLPYLKLEVFTFRFFSKLRQVGDFLIFGENEADSIGYKSNGGFVFQILYTDVEDYVLGDINEITHLKPIASSVQDFLKALEVCLEYQKRMILEKLKSKKRVDEISNQAAALAGDKEYAFFWSNLIDTI
ncbi:MAG: hypothetical protein ABJG41_18855 [Cyclobacteriaceae bacterium]